MRPARPLAVLALLAATAGACAPVAPPPGPAAGGGAPRQCFFASTVSGFREAAAGQRVNFRVGVNDVYAVDLFAPCPELRSAEKVLLDSRAGGSSVCSGLDVELIVPVGNAPPKRCVGRSVRKLSPNEIAALAPRERP